MASDFTRILHQQQQLNQAGNLPKKEESRFSFKEHRLPNLEPTKKLTIVSWHCSNVSTFDSVVEAVFIAFMNILKADIIFFQDLDLKSISGEGYITIKFNEEMVAEARSSWFSKRKDQYNGLFIRKTLLSSLFNQKVGKGGNCNHTVNGSVRAGGNIEYCSMDVLMEKGITRRLIFLYHPLGNKNCVKELDAVLAPFLNSEIETVLYGQANVKKLAQDKKMDLSEKLLKYALKSILPPQMCITHTNGALTYPYVLYSSINNKSNLLVHKPIHPFIHLLENQFFVDVTTCFTNDPVSHKIRELCKNYIFDSSCSQILAIEVGDEVNSGDVFMCCPEFPEIKCGGRCNFVEDCAKHYMHEQLSNIK